MENARPNAGGDFHMKGTESLKRGRPTKCPSGSIYFVKLTVFSMPLPLKPFCWLHTVGMARSKYTW